jgi:rare lipoprotein A
MHKTDAFDFPRKRNFSRLIFTSLVVLILGLTACASNTPPPLRAHSSTHSSHREPHYSIHHNAAYNRPYRVRGKTYYPMRSASGYSEYGMASWYGSESGNRTAMGTHFRPHGLTAAHKTLPLPTKVRVTNLHNGRSVDVIVNDRGPFKKGRIIDLSRGAAKQIGLNGVGKVKIEYLASQ